MISDIGKYYLYRHIRLDKNKPFYIGIGTKDSEFECPSNYKRSYDTKYRNKIWKDIYKKTEIRIEVLIESDDYNFIEQKEQEFISFYGRIDKNTGVLANLTDGGGGAKNSIRTLEHRQKISERLKGTKMSEASLEKRKQNWKRTNKDGYKQVSEKLSKPILQLDLEGKVIKEWKSITEASKNGYKLSKLSRCCNGKQETHFGYKWKFKIF
jgi:hypothetical protein